MAKSEDFYPVPPKPDGEELEACVFQGKVAIDGGFKHAKPWHAARGGFGAVQCVRLDTIKFAMHHGP